jgi:hypothetical protein
MTAFPSHMTPDANADSDATVSTSPQNEALEWLMGGLALAVVPALILEERATDPTVRLVAFAINWLIWLSLSNTTAQNVTTQATWQSSSLLVVTTSTTGAVTGIGAGEADVRATYQNVSGSQHVSICSAGTVRGRCRT